MTNSPRDYLILASIGILMVGAIVIPLFYL